MAVLKLLRNATPYTTHALAKEGLANKMSSLGDGEIAIATYEVDGSKKTLFAIKNLDSVTYFETKAHADDIDRAIEALDATVDGVSTDGYVKVNIVEEDGKLKTVTVTTDDIASAALLGTTSDDKTKATAFGYIAKEADDRATAITNAIKALKLDDNAAAKKFVTSVSETDGKIEVSRGEVTSTDKTVTLTDGADGGINLAVNVDGTTIVKDASTGKLSVASSALTQYVGDKAIAISDVDETKNEKTVSLTINSNEKVLSQDANGLKTTIVFKKMTTPSSANILEEYELQGIDGAKLGTETIKIYKDSSLVNFKLGHIDDLLTGTSSQSEEAEEATIVDGSGDTALVYVMQLTNGKYKLTAVNVEDFLQESEFKNGLQVDNHEVSVKIDSQSESFLTVSADGVKLSGVQNAITSAIDALNVSATTKSDTKGYVSTTISESKGKVSNDTVAVTYGDYNKTTQTKGIATTEDTKTYVDTEIAAKNVSAEGDDYVKATAASNKVTVETQVADLTFTQGSGNTDSTLTGTAKKLVKNDDVASKVNQFVNARIGEEVAKLDATVGATTIESGKHVAVQVVEKDGKLDSVTVTESDIASADDLTKEIEARKKVDGQSGQTYAANSSATYIKTATSLNDADVKLDAALKTADDAMLTGVTGSDAITVSTKANKNQTISLKLDKTTKHASSSAADNALAITVNEGLYLSSVWDCGTY